jgi:DNA-binding transcriptional MerR regulator
VAEALTIDELAERVGMSVRNLREWRTLGLLPRAEMRGRVGYYGPEVVERVERIKTLHAEGFTLELIRRMLDTGGDAGDEVMRLAEILRSPSTERKAAGAGGSLDDAGAALEELGLPIDEVMAAAAEVRSHTEAIAAIFERVWMEHIWEPFIAAGAPAAELARLQRAAGRLKPLTNDAVLALFATAMDERIEQGIARELKRASDA